MSSPMCAAKAMVSLSLPYGPTTWQPIGTPEDPSPVGGTVDGKYAIPTMVVHFTTSI